MVRETNTCPELDTEHGQDGSGLIDFLDCLTVEVDDLTDRMHQIKAISIMASRSLEETLACSCCAENVLAGVFKAIESISGLQDA